MSTANEATPAAVRRAAPAPGAGRRFPAARQRAGRRFPTPRHPEAWVLAGVTAAVYWLIAVIQWRRFESPSWDLGIFTQLAKAYADLGAPIVPIKGEGFNLLGDHFHPVLVLLGPVYRLFPSGLTLLVVQALLIAVSVVPLTRVAVDRLGRGAGVAVGVAYAFSFGIQGAVGAQFHEIAFALPLLALALEAFLRGRWTVCALWAAPLVLVKEDLGLTVAVLGFVLVLRGARREGLALAVWGVVWFLLAVQVILPALNPRGQWDYTDRLTLGDVAGDPLGTIAAVFTPGQKIVTALMLVGVAGVVGLRSPLMLVMVPTLAWRFVGNVHFYWGWTWHYNAVLMPVAIAALLDALGPRAADDDAPATPTSGDGTPAPGPPRDPPADGSVPAAPHDDGARASAQASRGPGRGRAAAAIAVSLLVSLLATPDLVLGRLVEAESYRPAERAEAAQGALDAVPEDVTVASDIALLAYLVPTTTTYWSGNGDNPATEYVVVDQLNSTWGGNAPRDAATYAEGKHPGTDYELVYDEGGYQVARLVSGP
ncbi:DUF2079 domain-containing protein [Georgenia faecalis]|uniref:DUF2079 domain-containing protein n=1 Tax=Georgenia faecalis TaxID=2483799 RepID=UPI000FD8060C|nr:DUF2079 domain-containing protein [Georgenia faecalis]